MGPTTYFPQARFEPDRDARTELERRGVVIEPEPVVAIAGESTVDVHLRDGRVLGFVGLFVASRIHVATPLAVQLGCALEDGPLGSFLRTDPTRETTRSEPAPWPSRSPTVCAPASPHTSR